MRDGALPATSEVAPGVQRIVLPTPFGVGPICTYLLQGAPLTLVDTGPASAPALDALEQGLGALGHRVEDLEQVFLTHQHADHIGLAPILARRSGAQVCTLDLLAPSLADFPAAAERDDELAAALMLAHGVHPEVVETLRAGARTYRGWGASAEVDRPLADGETLLAGGRHLTVQHRPGHSPSDTLLWDPRDRLLIGGDHLLGHISSNPLISRPLGGRSGEPDSWAERRPHALTTYRASLADTRALPAWQVLPGHGDVVEDHVALIDERFSQHDRRARRILRLIREEVRSAHAVARAIWGPVAITQAFLTLSEVLGHVDLLVDRDELREEVRADGRIMLAPGPASAD